MAHKWAHWLHDLCHLGGRQHFRVRDKISNGPQMGRLATSPLPSTVPNASERGTKLVVAHKCIDWRHHPCHLGGPQSFKAGDKISTGRQVGRSATSPLPSAVTNASKRGTKSVVTHKWVDWLHQPYHLGGVECFKAGDKISSGPHVGESATSPVWARGSPTLLSKGPKQYWRTRGHIGYITPATSGVSNTSQRGTKSAVAHKWVDWLYHPAI